MRSARVLVFLSLVFVMISAPDVRAEAPGDETFRGIPWGTALSTHPDMRQTSCKEDSCSYVRDKEALTMGAAQLTSITYRAYRDHLVEVIIEAPVEVEAGRSPGRDSGNFLTFRQLCHDWFGKTTFAYSFETFGADQFRWEETGIRKVLRVTFSKNYMQLSISADDLIKGLEQEEDLPGSRALGTGADTGAPAAVKSGEAEASPPPAGPGKSPKAGRKGLGKFFHWLFTPDGPINEDPARGTD